MTTTFNAKSPRVGRHLFPLLRRTARNSYPVNNITTKAKRHTVPMSVFSGNISFTATVAGLKGIRHWARMIVMEEFRRYPLRVSDPS